MPPTVWIPRWLEVGLGELQLGVYEVPGPASNPRINIYLVGVGMAPDDEIPWCAAFVNHCLEVAGRQGTGKAAARSYLGWGTPSEAKVGAVAVFKRGSSAWQGHVGFFLDQSASSIYLLGGNQSDRVSVAPYPREALLGLRWPST